MTDDKPELAYLEIPSEGICPIFIMNSKQKWRENNKGVVLLGRKNETQ